MPTIKKQNPVKEGFNKFKGDLKKNASLVTQGAKALINKVLKKKENSDLFSKKVH